MFILEEFKSTLRQTFCLNPLTSIHFAKKFMHLLEEGHDPQERILVAVFGEMAEKTSQLMINSQEFFTIFVDFMHEHRRAELETRGELMYWRMPHIQVLLKYIEKHYENSRILGDYFSKNMLRIDSEQLTFYLSQIFQSLNNKSADRIEKFLLQYAL